jgi:catechol 2,3-dioxygenase-like lactoylglutathione lyase family enzyme
MSPLIAGIHHVQLAMPRGGEADARTFYADVLGLREIPKPPHLAARGGAWFTTGSVEIHLGVEEDFRPARKAHPALLVTELSSLLERCTSAGYSVTTDQPLAGFERAYVADPFGNRIEFLEVL